MTYRRRALPRVFGLLLSVLSDPASALPPSHDVCTAAVEIASEDSRGVADLSGAARATDEPVNPCLGAAPEHTV